MTSRSQAYRPERPALAELSAGALVLLNGKSVVLMLHEKTEDRWCLPKGHVEPGESLEQACRREVLEETGLAPLEIGSEVGAFHYRFYDPERGVNVLKTVVYFQAVSRAKEVRTEPIFDAWEWLPLQTAVSRTKHGTDLVALGRVRAQGSVPEPSGRSGGSALVPATAPREPPSGVMGWVRRSGKAR